MWVYERRDAVHRAQGSCFCPHCWKSACCCALCEPHPVCPEPGEHENAAHEVSFLLGAKLRGTQESACQASGRALLGPAVSPVGPHSRSTSTALDQSSSSTACVWPNPRAAAAAGGGSHALTAYLCWFLTDSNRTCRSITAGFTMPCGGRHSRVGSICPPV